MAEDDGLPDPVFGKTVMLVADLAETMSIMSGETAAKEDERGRPRQVKRRRTLS
jgi:hypothetical protein